MSGTGWTVRPRSAAGHYTGLLSPTGMTAARVVAGDHRGDRVRGGLDWWSRRRARTQRGVVAGPGGRLRSGRVLPIFQSFMRNVTIHVGRTHARAVIPEVLRLMEAGALHPEVVTTLVAPLDDAMTALDAHCRPGAVKTVLTA